MFIIVSMSVVGMLIPGSDKGPGRIYHIAWFREGHW